MAPNPRNAAPEPPGAYVRAISDFFCLERRRGLFLSANDLTLVHQLAARGVPAEIVCAGIRQAFETFRAHNPPGRPPPSSLRYCLSAIEEIWASRGHAHSGANPHAVAKRSAARRDALAALAAELGALRAYGKALREPHTRDAYRTLYKELQNLRKIYQSDGTMTLGRLLELAAAAEALAAQATPGGALGVTPLEARLLGPAPV